ncbi:SAS6-like protein, putative [Hepatocystis sp. ex Piliocolobus tephrosceles]|nr:SAS6-like protein, putative [Hepatocystis sp. ex Piliocolobus tephrosceles]
MNKNDANNFLCHFDFSSLEELNPSLVDGYYIYYSKEVPCEIRKQTSEHFSQEVGVFETLNVQIFVLGEEFNAKSVKIELTSETNLFFHFTQTVNAHTFKTMQNKQKLTIDFSEYLSVVIKMFNSCVKEPQGFLAIFTKKINGMGQLNFVKNMQYKFIDLLVCDFIESNEDTIKESITYRYNVSKSKNSIMNKRLQDISLLIKSKNPSLLMQLQKTAMKQLDMINNKNNTKNICNQKWI